MVRRRLLHGLLLLASIAHWPPLLAQTVRGRVTDRGTGAAVPDARVLLVTEQRFGIAQFTTNDSGGFQLVAPAPGRYRLQFDRPGFRLLITPPFDLQAGETVDYALQVNPLPPFALDTAIVEGQVVPRRMQGFYQRRAQGTGEFVTRQELERWNPRVATDIVRHVPTFTLEIPPQTDPFREYRIVSRRAMQGFGPGCPPLVYLDDTRLGSVDAVDLDDVFAVGAIEAMEFYDGVQVPPVYQSNGSNCGVIAVWSRLEGSDAPTAVAHRIEVGAQLGGHVTDGGVDQGRVGAQVSIGLASVFEFYPAFNVFVQRWSGSGVPMSGWQALVALRARPFGVESPWYLGVGFTTIDLEQGQIGDPLFRTGSTTEHSVALAGVRGRLGWARPMVEIQLLDPVHPDRAQVHVYTGLAVRLR